MLLKLAPKRVSENLNNLDTNFVEAPLQAFLTPARVLSYVSVSCPLLCLTIATMIVICCVVF